MLLVCWPYSRGRVPPKEGGRINCNVRILLAEYNEFGSLHGVYCVCCKYVVEGRLKFVWCLSCEVLANTVDM